MCRERARTELASVQSGSAFTHTDHIQSVSEPQVWDYSTACSQPTTPDFKRYLSLSVCNISTMLWTANTIIRKFSSSSVSDRIFCIVDLAVDMNEKFAVLMADTYTDLKIMFLNVGGLLNNIKIHVTHAVIVSVLSADITSLLMQCCWCYTCALIHYICTRYAC